MAVTANVYTARVVITGTTALVMDNIQHADPEDPIAVQIKEITDKKTDMTAEDARRKNWLAYHAALYLDDSGSGPYVVMPWNNISRALRTGAFRIGGTSASGKIDGGVATSALNFPLDHTGPQDPAKLYDDQRFRFRTMVNKNPTGKKAMVPSVRPVFPDWGLTLSLTVFNDIIGWDVFVRVIQATGQAVGIGNARKLGYGRFTAEVTKI
jgi:hypothetical protein